jgi:eukaryotic-like serine/threonine-protein kinase
MLRSRPGHMALAWPRLKGSRMAKSDQHPQPSHGRTALADCLRPFVNRFEEAWHSGKIPDLATFLPKETALRSQVLRELALIDLECRLKSGSNARAEDYLKKFGELAADREFVLDLLTSEFEQRRRGEPRLGAGEYMRRFPAYASEILARIRPAKPPATLEIKAEPAAQTFGQVRDSQATQTYVAARTPGRKDPAETLPELPGYQIEGILGRGGMGVVYKAQHVALKRTVAVKMILAGGHAGPVEIARFRAEAEAVAQLQHPNIVQVHEIGEIGGCPFFSLEFVEGGSLASLLQHKRLSATVAARLIRTLADAMQYAHDRGIVHRDLKPANILVQRPAAAENEKAKARRKPAAPAHGTVKITDFGLAKQLDDPSGRTATGSILGTPSYMAPEQASGRIRDVGTAADIYALGAILYELLTGKPPFKSGTMLETLEQVRTKEPTRPSDINRDVPADLETICLKCLEKEIAKRYHSARELSDDLRRFSGGEPIEARPYGRVERSWRWLRRNPLLGVLGAVVVAAVFSATILLTYGLVQTEALATADRLREKEQEQRVRADRLREQEQEQRLRAEKQEGLAREYMYFSKMHSASEAWRDSQLPRLDELLEQTTPAYTNGKELRAFEWYYLRRLGNSGHATLKEHIGHVLSAAFSPTGNVFASAGGDGNIILYDANTHKKIKSLRAGGGPVRALAFSPDGGRLLSGGDLETFQGTAGVCGNVWSLSTGKVIHSLRGHLREISAVAWSPDGTLLATASIDGVAKVWDAESADELFTYRGHGESTIQGIAFGPDSNRIATCGGGGVLRIWEPRTGQNEEALPGDGWGLGVCFSPNGARVADTVAEMGVNIWDCGTRRKFGMLEGHTAQVVSVAYSRDGNRLATASDDMTVRIWDAQTRQELLKLRGHRAGVLAAVFSPDGKQLVSASKDGTVKVWPINRGTPEVIPFPGRNYAVAINPNGGSIAYGGEKGTGAIRDINADKWLMPLPVGSWIHALAVGPEGRRVAAAGLGDVVKVWEAKKEMLALNGHPGGVCDLVFTPDGKRLITAGVADQTVRAWDLATAKQVYAFSIANNATESLAISPDGEKLAVGLIGELKIYHAATGKEWKATRAHYDHIDGLAYSHDGRYLASASWDGTVTLWDSTSAAIIRVFKGHSGRVHKVLFSPDDRRVFSSSDDRTIRIWDVASGQEALILSGHSGRVYGLALSQDGNRLVSASGDGTVRIWDATPLPNSLAIGQLP